MYIFKILFIIYFLFLTSIFSSPKTIQSIAPPQGCSRVIPQEGTFSRWLTQLPLKKDNTILAYNGKEIERDFYRVYAVLDMPLLFKTDIEQCADYSMRLWAEYHNQNKQLEKLYLFNYSGNKLYFKNSSKTYKEFLKHSFNYSNSYSIKAGAKKITPKDLTPGDLIVQNETGGIGHVSVILDSCQKANGDKLFLIGYSFMPAQEFHIEKAEDTYGEGGWFYLKGYYSYLDTYLPYGKPVLRRF